MFEIKDYLGISRERITEQFKDKPILDKYVQLIESEAEVIQSTLADMLEKRWLENAAGKNLEIIGDIVGQPRVLFDSVIIYYFGFQGATGALSFGERTNLLQYSEDLSNSVWVKTRCSVSSDIDPNGGSSPCLITRTSTGNSSVLQTYTTSVNANKTFTFSVWLKAGTQTGNVVLRIRDGLSATTVASRIITPTESWDSYSVTTTFSGTAAANVRVYIDPQLDTGEVGDTFYAWGGVLESPSLSNSSVGGRFKGRNDPLRGTRYLNDSEYKALIRIKILKNTTRGFIDDFISMTKLLYNASEVTYTEEEGVVTINIGRSYNDPSLSIFKGLDEIELGLRYLPVPIGVRIEFDGTIL